MSSSRFPKVLLLEWHPEDIGRKRRRGRCHTRWRDAISRALAVAAINKEEEYACMHYCHHDALVVKEEEVHVCTISLVVKYNWPNG